MSQLFIARAVGGAFWTWAIVSSVDGVLRRTVGSAPGPEQAVNAIAILLKKPLAFGPVPGVPMWNTKGWSLRDGVWMAQC